MKIMRSCYQRGTELDISATVLGRAPKVDNGSCYTIFEGKNGLEWPF